MKFVYKRPVVSLSGSFFSAANLIKEYVKIVKKVRMSAEFLCIVTGGGEIARKYISLAKELGLAREEQDEMGIAVTRVNALLFAMNFGITEIPKSYEEAVETLKKEGFCICGGMEPGQSTDKVATEIAKLAGADVVINLTKVDGVYDKNPLEEGAKLLERIDYDELKKILSSATQAPGEYPLFDLKAIEIAKSCSLPIIIANGTNPENLLKILKGEKIGTLISSRSRE